MRYVFTERPYFKALSLFATSVLIALSCKADVAQAETSDSFEVSATIAAGCAVDGLGTSGDAGSVGVLNFGTDTTLSTATHTADLTASQTIVLRCTPGVALRMELGGGQHAGSGRRHMQFGPSTTNRLEYRLYSDAGMADEIGIDQQRSIAVTSANMNNVRLPVFGRISLTGGGLAGTYSDTLLVTLTW